MSTDGNWILGSNGESVWHERGFELRCDHAYKPTWNRVGDVGLDLYLPDYGECMIGGHAITWRTGVFIEHIPSGFWLQAVTPSGLARQGVIVGGGIFDTNYRGEIGIIWHRAGNDFIINPPAGMKIGALVIRQAFYPSNFTVNGERVEPQSTEPRGENGGLWNG